MQNAAVSNIFRISKTSKLIELLTRGKLIAADFQQLARELQAIAERAYSQRDLGTLREASALLLSLPGPQVQSAGLWYQALADKHAGQLVRASSTLERLIADQSAAPRFRARAFQSIGAINQERGDLVEASALYSESIRFIRRESPADLFLQMQGLMLLSAVQGEQRDPDAALSTLAQVRPIVEAIADPVHTAIFCNNAAVELLQLGRIQEAALYSGAALALPFASAYPEWIETAREIEQAEEAKAAHKSILRVESRPSKARARNRTPRTLFLVLKLVLKASLARFLPRQRVFRRRPARCTLISSLVSICSPIRAPSIHLCR